MEEGINLRSWHFFVSFSLYIAMQGRQLQNVFAIDMVVHGESALTFQFAFLFLSCIANQTAAPAHGPPQQKLYSGVGEAEEEEGGCGAGARENLVV